MIIERYRKTHIPPRNGRYTGQRLSCCTPVAMEQTTCGRKRFGVFSSRAPIQPMIMPIPMLRHRYIISKCNSSLKAQSIAFPAPKAHAINYKKLRKAAWPLGRKQSKAMPENDVEGEEPPAPHVAKIHRCRQLCEGERWNEDIEHNSAQILAASQIQHTLIIAMRGIRKSNFASRTKLAAGTKPFRQRHLQW